ncbi:MAG: alpha/beta hydrolase-fold protein [Prosthecobacter sp.]|nr:alpha/beta hydrolase-fold protein [Prosthecobacter sp.]
MYLRLFACLLLCASSALAIDDYKLGPLSQDNPKVSKGRVTKMPAWTTSKIYPGTTRDWWIYVPAQYKPEQPANLMVFQDGHDYVGLKGAWRVPTVFDNLIASGAMKPTIAIFINPGHAGAINPESAWRASNRGKEYNTLGHTYARFLLDEILPQVQKDYKLTENPEGWGIGGASSGAICAFTVAWERPDKFRKVFSTIGSYVNLAGGHVYPYLIRITERKPIRVFLQDGANDLDNPFGNWPIANRQMAEALEFLKYDVKFELGDGQHNSKHGASVFPEAMKWLWRK